jgi:predicted TIM-barrel fold metal-dependent hydrolase
MVPAVEHHAHVRSEAARDVLIDIQKAVGQEVMDEGAGGVTAADLIAALDSAGVSRAQVLSVAYFFGFPDVEIDDREAGVRSENDYVAQQVALFPDRLAGACSLNPLSDYAVDEVERCADDPGLVGLKLHFANSDVDLRDPVHVALVASVFKAAGDNDLPILVHMRTRAPDYGARDVEVFIDEVLSEAPTLPVQIAHMAGWGGYDQATDEALVAFIEAFRSGALDRDLYTFDLAAVVVPPGRAEPDTARVREVTEANETLSGRILELGPDRVLFATDWDVLPIGGYAEAVRKTLTLNDAEIADIMDNVGPFFR